jgi:hypothetical protein
VLRKFGCDSTRVSKGITPPIFMHKLPIESVSIRFLALRRQDGSLCVSEEEDKSGVQAFF